MIDVPVDLPVFEGRAERFSRRFIQWLRDTLVAGLAERPQVVAVQSEECTAAPGEVVQYDPAPSLGGMVINLPARPRPGDFVITRNATATATGVDVEPGLLTINGGGTFTLPNTAYVVRTFTWCGDDWMVQ